MGLVKPPCVVVACLGGLTLLPTASCARRPLKSGGSDESIFSAAGTGDTRGALEMLLKRPELANARDRQGRTPVDIAMSEKQWPMVYLLARCGAADAPWVLECPFEKEELEEAGEPLKVLFEAHGRQAYAHFSGLESGVLRRVIWAATEGECVGLDLKVESDMARYRMDQNLIVGAACFALTKRRDEDSYQRICEIIRTERHWIHDYWADALASMGTPESVRLLWIHAASEDTINVDASVKALVGLGNHRAVGRAVEALGRCDPDCYYHLARCLSVTTGIDMAVPKDSTRAEAKKIVAWWQEWWEKNRSAIEDGEMKLPVGGPE